MTYAINPNAKNVWIRDNEDTMDLSPITDASSVYLENGRTLEQELGEGSMVSNVTTVDTSMEKVIEGTLDGAYESGVLYGRSLVNADSYHSKSDFAMHNIDTVSDDGYIKLTANGTWRNAFTNFNGLLKPSTKYLAIVDVKTNTLSTNGINSFRLFTEGTNSNGAVNVPFIGQTKVIQSGVTGVFKYILTTMNDLSNCEVNSRNYVSNSVESGVLEYRYVLIEYQQGMENWDIPFFTGLCDVKMPILRNVGKNLLNSQSITYTLSHTSTEIKMKNSLKPNVTYTISFDRNGISWAGRSFYVKGEGFSSYRTTRDFDSKRAGITFSLTDEEVNVLNNDDKSFLQLYSVLVTSESLRPTNIQIEESSTQTPYEDHKSNILHTPETVTLRSLPNGVRDELNLKTGEYTQRITEIVLNGSEHWENHITTLTNVISLRTPISSNILPTSDVVCDKFITDRSDNDMEHCFCGTSNLAFYISRDKLSVQGATGLKEYLKQNPVTVQLQLITPVVKKVNLTQSEPIVKIGTELPNGVCDTYNLLTGEHIQRVGKVVLDGSEVWKNASLASNDGKYYISYAPLSSMKKYTNASGVISLTSDKFIPESPVGDDEAKRRNREFIASYGSNADVVYGESNWIYLSVEKAKIADSTSTAFSNYLKANPVTVWYELKNPIVTKRSGLPDTYGIVLPNGVRDTYDDASKTYTQNIGKVILNGTENWILGIAETTDNITFAHDILWGKAGHCVSSDRFETQYISSTNSNPIEDKESIICGNRFSAIVGRINITIAKSKLSSPTIEGFRQWLSQNPTTVYHELATPVETPICQINVGKVLPNGVCDTYNPVTKEYTQNIKKMVLNGDDSVTYLWETFSSPAEDTVIISITNIDDAMQGSGQITSDKIPFGASSIDDVESILYNYNYEKITIEILKSRLTELSLVGFKEWLKKNPLTIRYQLATPVVSEVDIDVETLYTGHPIAYENGHVILESGYEGQSLLPTLQYRTITSRVKQIESIGEQVLRQEKQLTMLEQMLIQGIIGMDYNNTLLTLNLEIDEVM